MSTPGLDSVYEFGDFRLDCVPDILRIGRLDVACEGQ